MVQLPVGAARVLAFDYGPVELDGDLQLEKLQGQSEVTRTLQGLVIVTELSTAVDSECGRCLTPVSVPISTQFTELFFFLHIDHSPEDLVLPEDGFIDLGPIAREQLLLEVPITVVCKPDCRGLCTTCGANLNEEDCGHRNDDIDPRLSSLSSLLNDS